MHSQDQPSLSLTSCKQLAALYGKEINGKQSTHVQGIMKDSCMHHIGTEDNIKNHLIKINSERDMF